MDLTNITPNIEFIFENDLGSEIYKGEYDNQKFIPIKGSEFAAAYDLRAYLLPTLEHNTTEYVILKPGTTTILSTNLKVALPVGYELNIYSRSGLVLNGIIVANAPGIIDSDYRGVVGVILHNQSNTPFKIKHGDRIAQCEIHKVLNQTWKQVTDLHETERGAGGYGHTGVK